jgi:hypothetical protein
MLVFDLINNPNVVSSKFLDRHQIYSQQRLIHRHQLVTRVEREISTANERRLKIQHRLYRAAPSSVYDGNEEEGSFWRLKFVLDLCLPGVFMPPNSRHIYNPRASQYFHPVGKGGNVELIFVSLPFGINLGTTDPRLTQPPSIFKLPPVPSGSVGFLSFPRRCSICHPSYAVDLCTEPIRVNAMQHYGCWKGFCGFLDRAVLFGGRNDR